MALANGLFKGRLKGIIFDCIQYTPDLVLWNSKYMARHFASNPTAFSNIYTVTRINKHSG
jgi:hypothetical protein